jgi:hypothetical protein
MPKHRLRILLLVAAFASTSALAQKVKVGYDKSVDFSKFGTYTWAESTAAPARPLLHSSIVSYVEYDLESKGLAKTDSNGDLLLMPTGGVDFGLSGMSGTPFLSTLGGQPPTINTTMWTGTASPSNVATWVSEGELVLTFIDRNTNTVIWTGSVQQKLDLSNQKKSIELVYKALAKLLKRFPPKRK